LLVQVAAQPFARLAVPQFREPFLQLHTFPGEQSQSRLGSLWTT